MDQNKCIDLFPKDDLAALPRDRFAFWNTGRSTPTSLLTQRMLLHKNKFNKGLGYTEKERQLYRLQGLLPYAVFTIDEQINMAAEVLRAIKSSFVKVMYLRSIEFTNLCLFYSLLQRHFELIWPIIAPSGKEALIVSYYNDFYLPRCMFITVKDKGHIYENLKNWPEEIIRCVYVTDGEYVSKSGDLGALSFNVVVNKAYMHTVLAGIKPAWNLPIMLDMGTNNQELLRDPFYTGLKQSRTRGQVFYEFFDEFMKACVRCWGLRVMILMDDFDLATGQTLLTKYRTHHCIINNDIQCMGTIGLAVILASFKLTNVKPKDYKILLYKCKPGTVGIANTITAYYKQENMCTPIWIFDTHGLIVRNRKEEIPDYLLSYAHNFEPINNLTEAVRALKPNVIIGNSNEEGAFNKELLHIMRDSNDVPVLIILSSVPECTAVNAFAYTNGKCLYVGGSFQKPVIYANKTYQPAYCSTLYASAGIAMGVLCAGMPTIPDEVFIAAAERLADLVPPKNLEKRSLLPPQNLMKCISIQVADAVMAAGYKLNIASLFPEPPNRVEYIKSQMFDFGYKNVIPETYESID